MRPMSKIPTTPLIHGHQESCYIVANPSYILMRWSLYGLFYKPFSILPGYCLEGERHFRETKNFQVDTTVHNMTLFVNLKPYQS